MEQIFYKYQGAGNDFVMIDNRHQIFDKKDTKQIVLLCDRRFGVGADGLILIENHNELDFEMIYYNADASQSFCGNGGRCAVAFAKKIGIIKDSTVFKAIDGVHKASISKGIVRLHMADVDRIEKHENHIFLNTGSPHHVQLENNIDDFDINYLGAKIRYGEPYNETGSNVNFVKKVNNNTFRVRTYERGVEGETLSCGTGVTAVAIAMYATGQTLDNLINLDVEGGSLQVSFDVEDGKYTNVYLIGPAKFVFKGII